MPVSNCDSCGSDIGTAKWARCLVCRTGVRQPCPRCKKTRARKWASTGECHHCYQRRTGASKRKAEKARAYGRRYLKLRALREKLCAAPCMDCGQTFPWYVMDFDHRVPADKSYQISRIKTVTRFLAEVKKCDVVCSNCHRIRTHKQREAGLIPRASLRTPTRPLR